MQSVDGSDRPLTPSVTSTGSQWDRPPTHATLTLVCRPYSLRWLLTARPHVGWGAAQCGGVERMAALPLHVSSLPGFETTAQRGAAPLDGRQLSERCHRLSRGRIPAATPDLR